MMSERAGAPDIAGAEPPLADSAAVAAVVAAGWPQDLPASTYALIERAANRFGDETALTFIMDARRPDPVSTWSCHQYREAVTRVANVFHHLGAGEGDVIAMVLPNLPETFFCLWGAEACGVALPINPLLEAEGVADLLRASGARIVVTTAPFPGVDLYDKVMAAVNSAPGIAAVVTVDLAPHVRGWKALPARVQQWRARRSAPALRGGVSSTRLERAAALAPGDGLASGRTPRGSDLASLFCTGGTTGAPKLARRTHANEVAYAFMSTRMLGDAMPRGSIVFAGLPLFHCNGAMVTGLSPLLFGGHVLLGTPQGYRGPGVVSGFWDIVARHRVNLLSGVPTLFSSLLQHPPARQDISALRFAICGAAPRSTELIGRFEAATGITILEGYGLTEATCVAALNPLTGTRHAGSVGLPLPFQQARIAVLDNAGVWVRDAAPGETGTLALAGPNVFAGYHSDGHNRGLWLTDPEGGTWLDTGDLGALDPLGYLWLRGRTKDIIIRGGHNIDPAVIEDAFYAHPAVALAAAIGRPDPHAGEVPVVYVELKPGAVADPAALMAFAETRISERAARPKAVEIISAMPLTAVGKVHKPSLRALL